MGNFITTTGSIFVPWFSEYVVVPYVFHPYRWGGISWDWKAPSDFTQSLVAKLSSMFLLSFLATIGGIMTTLNECRDYNIWISIKKSAWVILGWILGGILLFVLPPIKAPFLMLFSFVPYADYWASGMVTAIPILIMGAIGNSLIREKVC